MLVSICKNIEEGNKEYVVEFCVSVVYYIIFN